MSIIVTSDPNDIKLLLTHKDIEAVLWRREVSPAFKKFVKTFNEVARWGVNDQSFKRMENKLSEQGYDSGQIMIENDIREMFPELKPVWKDGDTVWNTLEDILQTPIYSHGLLIQKAQRKSIDRNWHRDRSNKKEKTREQIFFTLAHKQLGSQTLPKEDAGKATPYPKNNRFIYKHPKTIRNLTQAWAHDVLAFKTGSEGAVHRATYIRSGYRWLQFFATQNSFHTIRKEHSITPQ